MVLLSLALEEGGEASFRTRRKPSSGYAGLRRRASSDAVFNLALALEQGWGGAVDLAEAARLYAAAEAAGEPDGFCALARLHEGGLGVPQDPDQARRLSLRAFEEAMEAQTRAKAKSALERLGAAPPG